MKQALLTSICKWIPGTRLELPKQSLNPARSIPWVCWGLGKARSMEVCMRMCSQAFLSGSVWWREHWQNLGNLHSRPDSSWSLWHWKSYLPPLDFSYHVWTKDGRLRSFITDILWGPIIPTQKGHACLSCLCVKSKPDWTSKEQKQSRFQEMKKYICIVHLVS